MSCNGFDTSNDIYEDEIYTIGTCNSIQGGVYSYDLSCTDTSVTFVYYSGNDCTGSVLLIDTLTEGCYNDGTNRINGINGISGTMGLHK